MDKRVMFAVAGAGKTTYIVNHLSTTKRSLIITYTNGNYNNLAAKISEKFEGAWPDNVTLMTYFSFLYSFCYRPFLADKIKAKGVLFEPNPNKFAKQSELKFFLSSGGYFYSNRLSFFLEKMNVVSEIKSRIEKYFDEFIIDEIQDISGRDFAFLEKMMSANVNMLFVGDFYQHTFDTSRDGNFYKNLFDDKSAYVAKFTGNGFVCDDTTLVSSWRCSRSICSYVTATLGITISSNRSIDDDSTICFISDPIRSAQIVQDTTIVKLHYQNSRRFGPGHRNWGETKGEDCYSDVCVMLNKSTAAKFATGKLHELPLATRNKLYVAITRAKGNVYFINE